MTLYELTTEYQNLLELLEDGEAPEEAVSDTLEMVLADINDKAEGYGKVLKQMQADADALKAEKMRIAGKQSGIEKNIDRLRNAMLRAMQLTNQKSIKTPLFSFSTRTTSKIFLDVPEDQLPTEFQKVTVKADTKGIEKFMKDNAMLATTFAHFEPVDILTVR